MTPVAQRVIKKGGLIMHRHTRRRDDANRHISFRFRCLLAKRNHAITMLKVNVKFPSEAVVFTNILYLGAGLAQAV
jgi:hypothetical protein